MLDAANVVVLNPVGNALVVPLSLNVAPAATGNVLAPAFPTIARPPLSNVPDRTVTLPLSVVFAPSVTVEPVLLMVKLPKAPAEPVTVCGELPFRVNVLVAPAVNVVLPPVMERLPATLTFPVVTAIVAIRFPLPLPTVRSPPTVKVPALTFRVWVLLFA